MVSKLLVDFPVFYLVIPVYKSSFLQDGIILAVSLKESRCLSLGVDRNSGG